MMITIIIGTNYCDYLDKHYCEYNYANYYDFDYENHYSYNLWCKWKWRWIYTYDNNIHNYKVHLKSDAKYDS